MKNQLAHIFMQMREVFDGGAFYEDAKNVNIFIVSAFLDLALSFCSFSHSRYANDIWRVIWYFLFSTHRELRSDSTLNPNSQTMVGQRVGKNDCSETLFIQACWQKLNLSISLVPFLRQTVM